MALNKEPQELTIREQLDLAQLEEILEKKKLKAEGLERAKAVALSARTAIERKRADEERSQSWCPHKKEGSEQTALCACRNSGGDVLFVCQKCGKDYTMATCPPNLYPKAERVGGPLVGEVI